MEVYYRKWKFTPMSQSTRRVFLGAAGIAALSRPPAYGYPANDTIRVGVIGTGGRARRLIQGLESVRRTSVVGLSDIWDGALASTLKLVPAGTPTTKHYRDLLDRKDIDVVIIGAPDHWHVPMTIDAMAAGKDVYVEKPLTHSLEEGPEILAAAARHADRIVQVGTQHRSMPHLIKAREIVKSGRLGEIHKVHMTWNRNTPRRNSADVNIDPATLDWPSFTGRAPSQPFQAYRFRQWRWFWDFGGGIFTDLMVHWLDTANWILDLPTPASAASIGDNFHATGIWETPDTVQTLLHYPGHMQVYFEGTFVNARNAAMCEIMGSEATLYLDRGRYELIPERRRNAKGEEQPAIEPEEWILGKGNRGADFYDNPDGEALHLANWADCIRTRKPPATTIGDGVLAAAGAHLANLSLRQGRVVKS
jgi:predicted dehydrogenase